MPRYRCFPWRLHTGILTAAAALPGAAATTTPTAGHGKELSIIPGFGSVPPNFVKKIIAKEYVDIGELLPESWQVDMDHSHLRTSPEPGDGYKRKDFATMSAIQSSAFSAKVLHFFSYLCTIT